MASKVLETRGGLLRDINRLSTDILNQHDRLKKSSERLAAEGATKAALLEKLAKADAEYAAVDAQKQAESANDSELVGLQRAVSTMTLKRQELIKLTKSARSDRDKSKEDVANGYYARLGAEYEQKIASVSTCADSNGGVHANAINNNKATASQLPPAPAWSPEALKFLTEADAQWKRASNQSVITRDIVDAALQLSDLQMIDGRGEGSARSAGRGADEASGSAAAQLSAAGTSSMYSLTGQQSLLNDARKSIELLAEVLESCKGLNDKVRARQTLAGAGSGTTASRRPTQAASAADAATAAFEAVIALIALIKQNATAQRVLLSAVVKQLDPTSALAAAPLEAGEGANDDHDDDEQQDDGALDAAAPASADTEADSRGEQNAASDSSNDGGRVDYDHSQPQQQQHQRSPASSPQQVQRPGATVHAPVPSATTSVAPALTTTATITATTTATNPNDVSLDADEEAAIIAAALADAGDSDDDA